MFSTRSFVNKFRATASGAFATSSKRNFSFNTKDMLARENVPYYGAVIGVSALLFQVGVLHPFHTELSNQFSDIQVSTIHRIILSR